MSVVRDSLKDTEMGAMRVTLIMGAGGGLGRAASVEFASHGHYVACADISPEAAAETVALLEGAGHAAFHVDISDEASVGQLFDAVEARYGAIHILQNYAGLMLVPNGNAKFCLEELPLDDWERTFSVNCRGTFLCVREMLKRVRRSGVAHARIINISSSTAQLGGYNGSASYVASKGAILSLTKIAAREAAGLGMTVNCIAPGAIDTPMLRTAMSAESDSAYCAKVPMGRIGVPQDIASAALFLASPKASYITGSCVDVNGGLRMQ